MYQKVTTLTAAHLQMKQRECNNLGTWATIKAAKLSLKNDNKPYYVEVAYYSVGIVETEPKFGNWYKVTGMEVEKYIPVFAS